MIKRSKEIEKLEGNIFGNEKCKFFNNEIAGDSHFHFKVFVENIAMHGRLLTFHEVMKGYFKRA